MVSVIIINHNTLDLLKHCLNSLLLHHSKHDFEIVIIDNNSEDDTIEDLKCIYSTLKIIKLTKNMGFGCANNIASKQAQGDYLFFVNSDVLFVENSIDKMLNYYNANKDVGILGPKLLNKDLTFQLSAGKLPNIFIEIKDKIIYSICRNIKYFNSLIEKYFFNQTKKVEWVSGACMMIDKNTFTQVNGFDENFFLYFEDKDLCARVRGVNKKIIYYPETSVIHLLGGSSNKKNKKNIKQIYRKSQNYYYKKHLNKFHNILLKLYLLFNE